MKKDQEIVVGQFEFKGASKKEKLKPSEDSPNRLWREGK